MQQSSNKIIGFTVIMILLALYSVRSPTIIEVPPEEISVSLCHVYHQYDPSTAPNYRAVLSLLAILKLHDFYIGQPVWGPSNTLLYLCEHRNKTGLNQSTIDTALNTIIKNSGSTSKQLGWICA